MATSTKGKGDTPMSLPKPDIGKFDDAMRRRCSKLERELAQVRAEFMHAMEGADSTAKNLLRAQSYLYMFEELAKRSNDERALHLVEALYRVGDEREPWAREMWDRAWRRALNEDILKPGETAQFAGAMQTFGDEQYSEGKQDGIQKAINLISDEYAASPEARTVLHRILDALGDQ